MKHLYYCRTDECDEGCGIVMVAPTSAEARQMVRNEIGYDEWISATARRLSQDASKYPLGILDTREGLKIGAYSWSEEKCDQCGKWVFMTEDNIMGEELLCHTCLEKEGGA